METSVLQGAKELTATGSAAPDSFLHSNINLNNGANDSTGMIIDGGFTSNKHSFKLVEEVSSNLFYSFCLITDHRPQVI